MSNEFKHKDPGSELTQAEFIASDGTGHIFDSQAAGDVLYASSTTVLARLAKATDGNVLELASGLPAWTGSPNLTALTVDDVAIDGKVITMTGSSGDTAVFTVGANGTLSLVTVDTAASAANIQITADGTVDIDSAGVLTLDSGAAINIEPAAGSAILLDGNVSIDGDAVTGIATLSASGVITAGGFTIGSAVVDEAELEILDGATVTTTELNIIDGGTSATGTTIADADRVVLNDDGTMVQVAVTDLKTYIGGGPTEATEANIEDEITGEYYAPLDLIKHSPGVAKAWCSFQGNAGSMANDAAYNCDAPTDNGTGDWTINWTTDFSGIDYAVVGSCDHNHLVLEGGAADGAGVARVNAQQNTHGTLSDSSSVRIVAFGDQ
jgi:hypothetical protein